MFNTYYPKNLKVITSRTYILKLPNLRVFKELEISKKMVHVRNSKTSRREGENQARARNNSSPRTLMC